MVLANPRYMPKLVRYSPARLSLHGMAWLAWHGLSLHGMASQMASPDGLPDGFPDGLPDGLSLQGTASQQSPTRGRNPLNLSNPVLIRTSARKWACKLSFVDN